MGSERDTSRRINPENTFLKQLTGMGLRPDQVSACFWATNESAVPKPIDFSRILQYPQFSEPQRAQIIETWIEGFRNQIPIYGKDLSQELDLTNQQVADIAKRLNPNGTLSIWETIEAIREERNKPHYSPYHHRPNTIAAIARQEDRTRSSVWKAAKALGLPTKGLSEEEIQILKEKIHHPGPIGRPKKNAA